MTTRRDLTAEATGKSPTSVVDDRLMRQIVSDFRRPISQSTSLIPPSQRDEPARSIGENGWIEATPISTPPGVNHVDAIAESFARADRAVAIRQAVETQLAEGLSKGDGE